MKGKKQRASPAPAWGSAEAARHFSTAVRHHQTGQLREAEMAYRQALAADPTHADSLHLLGVLAHQAGHPQGAVEMIGKALARNDQVPEFHYNIGLAYGALRRFDAAAAHNAKAIALRPDYAEAHLNLGNANHAAGKTEQAIANYRRVLALRPDSHVAHVNLANVLSELGRADEAETHYARALALRPDYADAHNNLGTLLMTQGRAGEAAERHRRALALRPDLPTARANLANALRVQGRLDEAIACYREALAQDQNQPEAHLNLGVALLARDELGEAAACFKRCLALKPDMTLAEIGYARVLAQSGDLAGALAAAKRLHDAADTVETRTFFFECLRDPRALPHAAPYRADLTEALAAPWGNTRQLGPVATQLITGAPDWPVADGESALRAAKHDALLHALLESAPVADARLEQVVTSARAALLQKVSADMATEDEALLPFAGALARQCFINDYVFACGEDETSQVEALRMAIDAAAKSGAPIAGSALAALAAYRRLGSLERRDALLARPWPDAIREVIQQQIVEPRIEAGLRAAMPRLTPIDDDVSRAVRAQYEENPYPGWTRMPPGGKRQSVDTVMRDTFPLGSFRPLEKPAIDYLVAGCGTGQQVAAIVQVFSGVDVTAVDLSLASLGYSKRKTDALGFTGIAYGQADILELGSLNRSFDVVDSAGVLHHLRDPLAGWRVLVSLLRPNGLMRIALYSTIARRDITAARRFVAERGLEPTGDGIRRGRAALRALPDGAREKNVTTLQDFFGTSECRDLLFHVQEHTFDLREIARFLSENGFEFLGFDMPRHVLRRYAERFPDDRAKTNLENWHMFEQDNPETFIGMYQFWTQKRGGPAAAPAPVTQ
jgi:tetratricopeptide (TPR) repeat protein/SAM-dependent methyltransferase